MKQILDVGNCGPDHRAIRSMLETRFAPVQVLQAHNAQDTLNKLAESQIDLVLINRKLDQDYSDGVEILKLIRGEPAYAKLPVMLVSNFAEHQEAAVELGATYGFGKLELDEPATHSRIAAALDQA